MCVFGDHTELVHITAMSVLLVVYTIKLFEDFNPFDVYFCRCGCFCEVSPRFPSPVWPSMGAYGTTL